MPEYTDKKQPPQAVVFIPAGENQILATVDGRAQVRTVLADEAAAARLQNDLAAMLDAAAAHKRPRPCLYFDHRPGPAAAYPASFYWHPEQGIMLRLAEWTDSGAKAVTGGDYGYISPVFTLDRKGGAIVGLITEGVEIASLVNDPAFRTMPAVSSVAASHSVAGYEPEKVNYFFSPFSNIEHTPAHSDNKTNLSNHTQPMIEKLIQLLNLKPDASEEDILKAVADIVDNLKTKPALDEIADDDAADPDDKLEKLAAECAAKDAKLKEQKDAIAKKDTALAKKDAEIKKKDEEVAAARAEAARSFTDSLIAAGALAPRDTERISAARALYMADPRQARIALSKETGSPLTESVLANRPAAADCPQSLADMLKADFANL